MRGSCLMTVGIFEGVCVGGYFWGFVIGCVGGCGIGECIGGCGLVVMVQVSFASVFTSFSVTRNVVMSGS